MQPRKTATFDSIEVNLKLKEKVSQQTLCLQIFTEFQEQIENSQILKRI